MSLRTTEFQSTRLPARTRCKTTDNIFVNTGFKPRVLAGGRDRRLRPFRDVVGVSIHASSREDATPGTSSACVFSAFQSTRPRGRTRRIPCTTSSVPFMFQSTRPRGRTRPEPLQKLRRVICVSIHASSREDATSPALRSTIQYAFQSTRPRGRTRHADFPDDKFVIVFQSTRPRGRTRQ